MEGSLDVESISFANALKWIHPLFSFCRQADTCSTLGTQDLKPTLSSACACQCPHRATVGVQSTGQPSPLMVNIREQQPNIPYHGGPSHPSSKDKSTSPKGPWKQQWPLFKREDFCFLWGIVNIAVHF